MILALQPELARPVARPWPGLDSAAWQLPVPWQVRPGTASQASLSSMPSGLSALKLLLTYQPGYVYRPVPGSRATACQPAQANHLIKPQLRPGAV